MMNLVLHLRSGTPSGRSLKLDNPATDYPDIHLYQHSPRHASLAHSCLHAITPHLRIWLFPCPLLPLESQDVYDPTHAGAALAAERPAACRVSLDARLRSPWWILYVASGVDVEVLQIRLGIYVFATHPMINLVLHLAPFRAEA
jgi:hypothetical protein